MIQKKKLKDLQDMASLAAVDEAICKADSDWCSSLEGLGLESEEDFKRLNKTKEEK